MLCHLDEAFGAEGVFGVDVEGCCFESALFYWELDVDAELVADLAFATAVFAVKFGDCLGF